jgi:hypothetical protein
MSSIFFTDADTRGASTTYSTIFTLRSWSGQEDEMRELHADYYFIVLLLFLQKGLWYLPSPISC